MVISSPVLAISIMPASESKISAVILAWGHAQVFLDILVRDEDHAEADHQKE